MKHSGSPRTLKIQVASDYEAMSRQAAALIIRELKGRPDLLLCASAGGTPSRTYALLAERCRREPSLFKKLRVVQIDEWHGLPAQHPASCDSDLRIKLLDPLQVDSRRFAGFRTDAVDPQAECARVADWVRKQGPIDICILGLGVNGHVAMNEPAGAFTPHAHVARLAPSSRQHALLKPLKHKPRFGLTLGMAEILASRRVLLLANGERKRAAVSRLAEPRVSTRFPGSLLWLHPDATVFCDAAAAPEGGPASVRSP